MEILALFILLTMTGKNADDLKSSLNSALSFYRENRELFTLLSGMQKVPAAQTQSPPQKEEQIKTEPNAFDSASLFEQYLKTHAI